ncbi:hypothetical protein DR999_PMT22317 [Platysternon megacephalum]|uniref:Uncharacterized protein n=1 Tax=Platysternon megacephalum TaxID=55544 RepID=A0A4D9DES4_9SAUR|nr:hypothetical protein DR999_PMT22317 [Platysternon megacephalum]
MLSFTAWDNGQPNNLTPNEHCAGISSDSAACESAAQSRNIHTMTMNDSSHGNWHWEGIVSKSCSQGADPAGVGVSDQVLTAPVGRGRSSEWPRQRQRLASGGG